MIDPLNQRIPPLLKLSNFPIEGIFREPIIGLEVIIIFLSLQYGIFFLYKFIKEEGEKNFMIRAWSIFFISYSLNVIFFIMSDFLSHPPGIRQIYIDIGYIVLGFGALFFSYNAEHEIQQKNHIFSIITALLLALLITDTVLHIVPSNIVAIFTNIPFIILLFVYILKFTSKIKDKWKLNIYGFIVGFLIWISGFALIIDLMVDIFGIFSRFLGDLLIIIGISLISLLFVGLPSLNEFEWPKKIRHLFIMYKNGKFIADYNFQKNSTNMRDDKKEISEIEEIGELPQLITGGLTSINKIITELVHSNQKLEIIDHQDLKVILQYGNYLVGAIIVDEVLDIYKTKLKKMINYLEGLYETYLASWDGDLTQFQIVYSIIRRYFSL